MRWIRVLNTGCVAGSAASVTVNASPTTETRSFTNTMAKQLKNKYLITIPVTELVPDGEKPMKLKDIKAVVEVTLGSGTETLTAGKVKVEAV